MRSPSYYLGCPSWGMKEWVGELYSADARPVDFLRQYTRVFATVEGNTTFYHLPSAATVERWREAAPAGFRFCFKLPRRITHELFLRHADAEVAETFRRLEPLGERLGPFMVQLPPSFGPAELPQLDAFLATLPREHRFAVEVRHRALFTDSERVQRLDELLERHRCGRVILDTRPLRAGDPSHPDVVGARTRKPDLPVRVGHSGALPLIRLISHPDAATTEPWLGRWAEQVAAWIGEGLEPYFFVHCPDDRHSPGLARRFHALVRERVPELPEMPPWLGESRETADGQLSLL